MSSKSAKSSKASLKEKLHKKARLAAANPRKPILKTSAPKPALKTSKPIQPQPSLATHKKDDRVLKVKKDTKGKAKATSIVEDDDVPPSLPSSFKIIAGSYEKLLYGLQGTVDVEGSSYKFHIKPVFIFPAHMSCVRAVAASPDGGKWLATGSADEIIKVWDLRRRKEIGGLMQHQGSITHLSFPSRSHLLSASEDGTLCLFHARDWTILRTLKGHKGRVNCVAVHPSGKVALSVGKDRTLRMWDLMRGKASASTKIYKEGELVRWSVAGDKFIVQAQSTLDVYSTDMTILHTITHPSRIHDIRFTKRVNGEGELLLVAAENKLVTIYDVPSIPEQPPTVICELFGHQNRVKAVDTLSIALPPIEGQPDARTSTIVATTISSDGWIRVFDLADVSADPSPPNERVQLHAVAEYDTKGTRLTCMVMADGEPAEGEEAGVVGKRKRAADSDGEEEDSDEDIGVTGQDNEWEDEEEEEEEEEEEVEEEVEEEEEEEEEEE